MNICPVCGKSATYTYCSLSCSNRGRPKILSKQQKQYLANPKYCPYCKNFIQYKHRENKYCSHACAAKAVGMPTGMRRAIPGKRKKVCKPRISLEERFAIGDISLRYTLRKVLKKLRGDKCEECNINALWRGKPLVLIVDHKDGNAGNNFPDNVRLLCPNCNSQTSTFSGRNKGNGRKARGLPR